MPVLRSAWSEFLGYYEHSQFRMQGWEHPCSDFELNAWECMEAYGIFRGEKYCRTFLEDYNECITGNKMYRRVMLMRRERMKQMLNGERKPGNYWGERPPKGSFNEKRMMP